jgi:hypothetical protein
VTRTISGNNINVIKGGKSNNTLSEQVQFNRQIGEIEGKSTPLGHIYMTRHFTGFFMILYYCKWWGQANYMKQ